MKTKRFEILFIITLLSGIYATNSNSELVTEVMTQQDTNNEIPFIFSFCDNTNPAMNPFAKMTTNFHLSIISGRVGSVNGLQLGWLVNHVKYNFVGYDGTGIYSTVGGDFSGIQHIGIYSRIEGNYVGIQDVGIYSFVGSDFLGIQTTGIANQVKGSFIGVQIAGISNQAKQVDGLQIAGIINNAEQLEGLQIAGIVNNGGRVTNGLQIGLINLSEELRGIAIGLVNISKVGSVHGIAWSGGAMDMNAGIKFAPNHYWYTILSLGRGSDFANDENDTSFGYYMGFRFPIVSQLFIELDVGSNSIFADDLHDDWEWEDKVTMALETRASLVFQLHKRLSLQVGLVHTRTGENIGHFSGSNADNSFFFGIQF